MKQRRLASALVALVLAVLFTPAPRAEKAASTQAPPPAPPLPAIRALKLLPESLTLADLRDERRVLVLGVIEGDKTIDLTAVAKFSSDATCVEIGAEGYIRPKSGGAGEIIVKAAGQSAKLAVKVQGADARKIDFVRDVQPVLAKLGCNQGTCHGSAQGKNGFKLSLRGYDPEYDYAALVNDLSGRRFNRVNVDDSLMLLKPLGEVPHEGRQALKPGSREHQMLRQWITEGTKFDSVTKGRAKSIELLPKESEMDVVGRSQQFLVIATYADGSTRDVTREAHFSVSNIEVTEVNGGGVVKGLRRGEAALLVRYEGIYGTALITVMGDRTGYQWADVPENNFIDQHVNTKLRKMKILPSELTGDGEFMRRVYLDLTGLPPLVEKVRAFLEDKTPSKEKREKLIDELLGSNDYVEFWANKWADLLQCNSENLGRSPSGFIATGFASRSPTTCLTTSSSARCLPRRAAAMRIRR
ncbi:MAG: DUF1549 domain-containing protein [Verrucomicrobia bacterium]|nr:DUF1549 domain-containing protein [Verrucomicrobiota bacterium]